MFVQQMQNIIKKVSPREASNNPQINHIYQNHQYQINHLKREVSSQPYLNKRYPREFQIQKYLQKTLKDQRQQEYQQIESINHFQQQNQKSSISEDWKVADLIEYSRLKKRQDGEHSQLLELRKIVKTILKSNQEYRMKLLEAQQEKTQAKLQNVVLSKQVQHLENEKQTWIIQKSYNSEMEQFLKTKQLSSKQFYQKSLKKLQNEVQKTLQQLQVQKKRNSQLQQYNKSLFQKVTQSSENHRAQLQKFNNNENGISSRLQKMQSEIKILNHQKNTYIEQLDKAVQKGNLLQTQQKELMMLLKTRQREVVDLRGKLYQLQKIVQQLEKDKKSNLQQYTRKIDYLNCKLEGQKEILFSKNLEAVKYEQLKNAFQSIKQENSLLKQKQSLIQQLKLMKNSLQLRLVESELRCDERDRLLSLQQSMRLNLDIQLNRFKQQLSFNYEELLCKHQHEIQNQRVHFENKLLRITNDLLNERKKSQEIISNMTKLQQQNKRLLSQVQDLKHKIISKQSLNTQNNKQIEEFKGKIKQHEIFLVQNSAKLLEKQLVANNLQKNLEQTIKKYQKDLALNKTAVLKLQTKLNQQKTRYQAQKQNLNAIIKELNQKLQQNNKSKSKKLNEAYTKVNSLQNQIQYLNDLCDTHQKSLKDKNQKIEGEISGGQKLKNTIIELKRQNHLLELQNNKLQQQNISLALRLQKIQQAVQDKNNSILQKDKNIEEQNQIIQTKIQNLQSEILILRSNNQQLRQRYLKMEKQLTKNISTLQKQVNNYEQNRNIKVVENIHNLTTQILKSQKIIVELTHPAPNSIKKFINLMSSAHRQNLSRQIQKITEYYTKIEQTKSILHKYYNNMKIIINLIQPNSFANNSPRNSPQKYEK